MKSDQRGIYNKNITKMALTSHFDIDVPTKGLLAVKTESFGLVVGTNWLAHLNNKQNVCKTASFFLF